MKPQNATPAAPTVKPGQIDVEPIIAQAAKNVPAELQNIFGKAVISGMRIMFDKQSFAMTMQELQGPGPLAQRLSDGTIKLVYLLWTQSNKTLPPQIIVPLTLTLVLKAFAFTQLMGDPEATKETLGDATHGAVQGVMDRFGATEDKLPQLAKAAAAQGGAQPAAPGASQAPAGAPPAAGGGMLDAAAGGM